MLLPEEGFCCGPRNKARVTGEYSDIVKLGGPMLCMTEVMVTKTDPTGRVSST